MALLIQSKEIIGRFDVSGNFAVPSKKNSSSVANNFSSLAKSHQRRKMG